MPYILPTSFPTSQSHQIVIFVLLPVSYLLQRLVSCGTLEEAKPGSWRSQMSGSTKQIFSSGSCLSDHFPPKAYIWFWWCICWWLQLVSLKVKRGISSQWKLRFLLLKGSLHWSADLRKSSLSLFSYSQKEIQYKNELSIMVIFHDF